MWQRICRPRLPAGGLAVVCVTTSCRSWSRTTPSVNIRQAPRRGDIFDIHGNLLATSVPVKTICADPSLFGNQQAVVAHALAPLLQMSETGFIKSLFPRIIKRTTGRDITNNLHYVRLKKVRLRTHGITFNCHEQLSAGVDEKKLSKSARESFRNLRQERNVCRSGPDARLPKRHAGGPGSRISRGGGTKWMASRFRKSRSRWD